jgi:hypothetical protein
VLQRNHSRQAAGAFTQKLRKNIEFGFELWSALANNTWRHNDDPNKNDCGMPSFRGAAALLSSMLGFEVSQMDWLEEVNPGAVSEAIKNARTERVWLCEH